MNNSRLTCDPIFEEMLPFFPFVENSHNWLKFIVNFLQYVFNYDCEYVAKRMASICKSFALSLISQ